MIDGASFNEVILFCPQKCAIHFICLPISFSDIFVIVFPSFNLILRLAVCITTSLLTCGSTDAFNSTDVINSY